ncbi:hypothetical protein BOX15_Mlig030755g2, partial [Macrostomum lignano]
LRKRNYRILKQVMPATWHILYGSQTGQAQAIAEDIASELQTRPKIRVELRTCNEQLDLATVRRLIIVCSSTGDGDAPDNAAKFVRLLSRSDLPADAYSHIRFSLLGLGDTNYTSFGKCPQTIETKLKSLGAELFLPTALADDAVGLELTVGPFLERLWPAVDALIAADAASDVKNDAKIVDNMAGISLTGAGSGALDINADIGCDYSDDGPVFGDDLEGVAWPDEASLAVPPLPARYLSLVDHPADDGAASVTVDAADAADSELCGDGGAGGAFGRPPGAIGGGGATYLAPLLALDELSSSAAPKRIWRVSLDVSGAGAWAHSLAPGDAISLCPANCPQEVDDLLHRLGVDGRRVVRLVCSGGKKAPDHLPPADRPVTLASLLLRYVDIRQPPSNLLRRVLAEYAGNRRERLRLRQLCARQTSEAKTRLLLGPRLSLLDLLRHFPSCRPPLDHLLPYLPRLQARPYSLANYGSPSSVKLYFSEVYIPAESGRTASREGVATGWLRRLSPGARIPVYGRENRNFRLTESQMTDGPLLLIGPGTGCAPLCAFLDWRRQRLLENGDAKEQQLGEAWLLHGCRRPDWDFAFREPIEVLKDSGAVQQVRLAFSRLDESQIPKLASNQCRGYVTNWIATEAAEIRRLLLGEHKSTCCVLVCGDATGMAKDVLAALEAALTPGIDKVDDSSTKKSGGGSAAAHLLARMRIEGRYKEDVWS